ncbi:MAG: RluA family pseudouridine synthase [Oscillospiraceae bacterium]|nr:RluA family pseudouridine synthase [Oscillospiraceae bacterium]
MTEFIVTQNDAGQRLDRFLQKAAPGLPVPLLYKSLRTKHIKLNGKRAQGPARLKEGDRIRCWMRDELFAPPAWKYDFLRAGRELSVLYEDGHILLLDKKAGLLSHPDEREYIDTLLGRIQRYLYEKGEYDPEKENAFAPALVNRIDRNTRGIVIAAKTAQALRVRGEKMKRRELRKLYLCAAHGRPEQGEPVPGPGDWRLLRHWLRKDEGRALVRVFDQPVPGAKESLTKYRVLAEHGGLSLLEAELLTGRTHQIRAQLAAIGHALVGDGKYAPRAQYQASGRKQQCLCSHRLAFAFDTPAEELEYLNGLDVSVPDVPFIGELFPDYAANS